MMEQIPHRVIKGNNQSRDAIPVCFLSVPAGRGDREVEVRAGPVQAEGRLPHGPHPVTVGPSHCDLPLLVLWSIH